ncbi:unnamed protein product [Staurois parvus]|uniref:Uncharacterized protein n=1 Tax=Staurois parvus TaxID=386267 RepID=A0ABN9FLG5_9NEOB|nr:unnamed protein product [Staurois parvus]
MAMPVGTDGRNCLVSLLGSTDGWHCLALMTALNGTDGHWWEALLGTGGWHCWAALIISTECM